MVIFVSIFNKERAVKKIGERANGGEGELKGGEGDERGSEQKGGEEVNEGQKGERACCGLFVGCDPITGFYWPNPSVNK